jgi:hypothetical protein
MNKQNLKRPWRPGESGNPHGRPRVGLAIAELARAEIEKRDLIRHLGSIAAGKSAQAVRACEILLAYAYGKPHENPEEVGNVGERPEITINFVRPDPLETLRDRVARIVEREQAAAAANGADTALNGENTNISVLKGAEK